MGGNGATGAIYGELTEGSMQRVLDYLATNCDLSSTSLFIDVGTKTFNLCYLSHKDFKEWTIVIFDNFLILANDYEDAATKLERTINRCAEFGVVLKIKKRFIGVDTVTFFGYEVSHGKWKLSEARKI